MILNFRHTGIPKFFNQVLEWYVYGSFHMALCTTAYALFFYKIFGLPADWVYLGLVSLGTHIIYSLHKVLAKERIPHIGQTRFRVILGHQSHIIVYIFFSAIVGLVLSFYLSKLEVILLIFPSVLSLLYVAPVFGKRKRLRDFAYVKIFLISLCFALICTFNPLVSSSIPISQSLTLSLSSFLFILGITLPFDIRDVQLDKNDRLDTIITLFGEKNSKFLAITSLAIAFILFLLGGPIEMKYFIAFTFTCFTGIVMSWFSHQSTNDYYYSLFMDGLLALPLVTEWLMTLAG